MDTGLLSNRAHKLPACCQRLLQESPMQTKAAQGVWKRSSINVTLDSGRVAGSTLCM